MTDWTKIQKEFDDIPEGAFLKGSDGEYYIKQEQRIDYHIDGMMLNLFTGKFRHFSHCTSFQQVYGFEIPW